MSLVRIVTELVELHGKTTADQLVRDPYCEGYTRAQIVTALRNAAHFGHIHCVGRVVSSRAANARAGVYEPGPAPAKNEDSAPVRAGPPRGELGHLGRITSVFQMGGIDGAQA